MNTIKILLLPVLVVVAIGVLLELGLRIAGITPTQGPLSADLATYDKGYGIWTPDQELIAKNVPSLPHKIRINSAGYRGVEFDTQKTPDEFRVFMVGDSFTFGTNVDEAETLVYQIDQKLKKACDKERVTLINAGIMGSTIRGQTEMVMRGMPLNPDVVVLVFTETDIPELTNPLWDRITENRIAKSKFPVSVFWPIVRDTAIFALIAKVRDSGAIKMHQENELIEDSAAESVHAELRRVYLKELNDLALKIEEEESKFIVATFPGSHTTRGEPYIDTMVWAMQEFPKHVTTINLLDPLRQALEGNTDRAYLLPEDGHPSKLGYEVAAATIARQLMLHPELQNRCSDS